MKARLTGPLLLLASLAAACLSQVGSPGAATPSTPPEPTHETDAPAPPASDNHEPETNDNLVTAPGNAGPTGEEEREEGGRDEGEVDEEGAGVGDDEALSLAVPDSLELSDEETWIFIDKSERRMVVNDGRGYREAFRVALGQNPQGDKRREGDGRTPEGEFYVCRRIVHNRFHRFLALSYPGPEDAQRGRQHRMLQPIEYRAILRAHHRRTAPPWDTALGGNLGIHGYGRRQDRAKLHARGQDWTDGCIAVSNDEIERIYEHTRLGTRIFIEP